MALGAAWRFCCCRGGLATVLAGTRAAKTRARVTVTVAAMITPPQPPPLRPPPTIAIRKRTNSLSFFDYACLTNLDVSCGQGIALCGPASVLRALRVQIYYISGAVCNILPLLIKFIFNEPKSYDNPNLTAYAFGATLRSTSSPPVSTQLSSHFRTPSLSGPVKERGRIVVPCTYSPPSQRANVSLYHHCTPQLACTLRNGFGVVSALPLGAPLYMRSLS